MGLWQRFGRFGFMDLVDKGGLDEKRAGRVAMLVIILLYKVIPNHATQYVLIGFGVVCCAAATFSEVSQTHLTETRSNIAQCPP